MATKVVSEKIETVEHPLEEFFGIEPNSTEVVTYEQKTDLVEHEDYDSKDTEIEDSFQEIYDEAMSGYKNLQDSVEDIEPKFQARTLEVANQLLSTALAAAKEKAGIKQHKDKLSVAKTKLTKTNNKTVNNTIVVDTSSLVQQLKNKSEPIAVEATVVDNTTDALSKESGEK